MFKKTEPLAQPRIAFVALSLPLHIVLKSYRRATAWGRRIQATPHHHGHVEAVSQATTAKYVPVLLERNESMSLYFVCSVERKNQSQNNNRALCSVIRHEIS